MDHNLYWFMWGINREYDVRENHKRIFTVMPLKN